MTAQEFYNAFNDHLQKSGRQYYREFYCGITDNIERRLFEEHNVSRDSGFWIYGPADNIEVAREVERHYLDLGMQGNTGGGNEDSIWVYCYLIMQSTKEGSGDGK